MKPAVKNNFYVLINALTYTTDPKNHYGKMILRRIKFIDSTIFAKKIKKYQTAQVGILTPQQILYAINDTAVSMLNGSEEYQGRPVIKYANEENRIVIHDNLTLDEQSKVRYYLTHVCHLPVAFKSYAYAKELQQVASIPTTTTSYLKYNAVSNEIEVLLAKGLIINRLVVNFTDKPRLKLVYPTDNGDILKLEQDAQAKFNKLITKHKG